MKATDNMCQHLSKLLDDPQNWHIGKCLISHSSGVEIWIDDGFLFFEIKKPNEISIPLFKRLQLYRKFLKIKQAKEEAEIKQAEQHFCQLK